MNFTIPIGKTSQCQPKAFDAANTDITSTGTFAAVSDNTGAVTVTPGGVANTFSVKSTAVGTAHITYTFTNPSGTLQATDTINPPDPATSITTSYSTPI